MENIFSTNIDLNVDFSAYRQELLARFRSRLLYQFKNSPVLDQFIQAIALEAEETYIALLDCLEKRTLATAEGVQLDGIGELVGQYRLNINGATKVWFTPDVNKLDEIDVWCDPASLYEDTVANDIEYRRLILSKIFRNHVTSCSIPELRYFIRLLTNENVSFLKMGSLQIALVVKENIKPNILAMLVMEQFDDKKNGERYFLPFSATTSLFGVVFSPIDVYSNSIGFTPDIAAGRSDYAEYAVLVN
jgi:hypothetical protein